MLAIKLLEREVEERFIRFQEPDFHTNKESYDAKAEKRLAYMQGSCGIDLDQFLASEEMMDVCSFVKHWFGWKQGKYTLTLEVESPERFKIKDNVHEFSLNALDIEGLEANKGMIESSYEDQMKAGVEGYSPKRPIWNWTYPVLRKSTALTAP